MILLPGVSFYFKKDTRQHWSVDDLLPGDQFLFLLLKEAKDPKKTNEADYYPVGFSAEFVGEDSEGLIQMRTKERLDVSDIENVDGVLTASGSIHPDCDPLSEEEKKNRFEVIRADYLKFIQKFQWGVFVRNIVLRWDCMEEMMCSMSAYLNLTWEERYALMELDSETERYERMEEILRSFMAESDVKEEAAQAHQNNQEQLYKEAALKKQIRYMQEQVEEMHPENISDVRRFEQKIAESGMNEIARKEAEKILNRMKQEGEEGHEYGIHYDYLDFVTGLSWKKADMQDIDLKKVNAVLDEDHFGLKKVKDRIVQQMAVMALNK